MKSVKTLIKRGPLSIEIVHLLGLLDKKINGPTCRLDNRCPAYKDSGIHHGDCAYHIEPQQSGAATRFMPENVVWACRRANFGESFHRSAYKRIHLDIFGPERIARIESAARTTVQYSMAELLEIRDKIKSQLEKR